MYLKKFFKSSFRNKIRNHNGWSLQKLINFLYFLFLPLNQYMNASNSKFSKVSDQRNKETSEVSGFFCKSLITSVIFVLFKLWKVS